MDRLALACLSATLFLAAAGSHRAVADAPRALTAFDIELRDVPRGNARGDLLNLFIRENANQTRIDLTLTNPLVKVGRSQSLYYLRDLRVAPGQVVRITAGPDARPFEAEIRFIEAFFPRGKPPQLVIRALGPGREAVEGARPYPRLSSENFRGRRTLVEEKGKRKPDLVTCTGDTPGDLRIRFGGLVEVEGVGRGFSTTYVMDDVQHRWDPANGLQTRYQGTRHAVRRPGR